MTYGTVTSVEKSMLGSALLTAAALGDTVLQVEFAGDFDEDGGQLLLNDNVLDYTTVDNDADTITLATPLPVAAATDDPVQVVDAGEPGVEWIANVAIDEGDTIAATIPTALIGYFPEGTYDEPMQVEIELHNGSYDVVSQPVRDASFDGGAVWNPHALADIPGGSIPNATYTAITGWTARDVDGITAVGSDYIIQYPGVYAIAVQVAFASNNSGRRRARVLVNGDNLNPVLFRSVAPDPGVVDYVGFARDVRLAENDVVTVEVWQDSGAALTFGTSAGSSNFSLHRVSV